MKKRIFPALHIAAAFMVFGFLCYGCPWLLTAREQSQLWLYNSDYLLHRLSENGGVARYAGEFLVQFDYSIFWGAVVTALFFLALEGVWWLVLRRIWQYYRKSPYPLWLRLLSLIGPILLWSLLLDINVQMTLPVAIFLTMLLSLAIPQRPVIAFPVTIGLMLTDWWVAGPVCLLLPLLAPWSLLPNASGPRTIGKGALRIAFLTILLMVVIRLYAPHTNYPLHRLLVGIDYVHDAGFAGTSEEQQYDLLVHLHLWERLLKVSKKQPPKSRACQYAVLLAEWKLWNTREAELRQSMQDTWGSLSSCAASFLMSDLYLQLGWINMSQRAAYEAMVSYPNYNCSGRALKRLTEMSLITGQYDLVRKYAGILRQAPFYHSWAEEMLQLVEHPERIERNVNCMRLRQIYHMTPDGMFY
ncbi:MAG: hypothetical protein IJV17_02240 [Prevotella sp.]|nr:hypothetical protein [Prevotella sp.]